MAPPAAGAQAGALDLSYAPSVVNVQVTEATPEVHSVLLRADGKILVQGDFNAVNGTNRPGLALLNPDGSLDLTFVPVANGQPFLQPDGKVLINQGSLLLRLNADGNLDGNFVVQPPPKAIITTLALQPDGRIILDETTNGGASALITRVNADGTPDESLARVIEDPLGRTNAVMSLAVQIDGRILVGGELRLPQANNLIGGLTRLDSTGNADAGFTNTFPNIVSLVMLQLDGRILAAHYNSLLRAKADGSIDAQFQSRMALLGFQNITALALESDGTILVVGSAPGTTNLSGAGLVRLNSDGSLDAGFSPVPMVNLITNSNGNGLVVSGTVSMDTLAVQADGRIIFGGRFTGVGGTNQLALARLRPDGSLDPTFQPRFENQTSVEVPARVNAIVVQPDGKAVVGGSFNCVDHQARTNLVRLNRDGSLDATFSAALNANDVIKLLALQPDSHVLVAGAFTNLAGVARNQLARLNPDGSLDTSFDFGSGPTPGGNIWTVAQQADGKVLIGGSFSKFSGRYQFGLVRLNTDGSLDTNFLNGAVSQLRSSVVAGYVVGGSGVHSIALAADGHILLSGTFQIIASGLFRSALAAFDGAGNLDAAFAPYLLGSSGYWSSPWSLNLYPASISTLAIEPDDGLFIQGNIAVIDGSVITAGWAKLNAEGRLASMVSPPTWLSNVTATAVQPDGRLLVGGSGLVRLNTDGSLDQTFEPRSRTPGPVVSAVALEPEALTFLVGGLFYRPAGSPQTSLLRFYTIPQPSLAEPARTADGALRFTVTGDTNHPCRIEVSSNLVDWTPAASLALTNGSQVWEAGSATNTPRRFYRAVSLP